MIMGDRVPSYLKHLLSTIPSISRFHRPSLALVHSSGYPGPQQYIHLQRWRFKTNAWLISLWNCESIKEINILMDIACIYFFSLYFSCIFLPIFEKDLLLLWYFFGLCFVNGVGLHACIAMEKGGTGWNWFVTHDILKKSVKRCQKLTTMCLKVWG